MPVAWRGGAQDDLAVLLGALGDGGGGGFFGAGWSGARAQGAAGMPERHQGGGGGLADLLPEAAGTLDLLAGAGEDLVGGGRHARTW